MRALRQLRISLKIITGDNRAVAATISRQVGIAEPDLLTGAALHQMSDAALLKRVSEIEIFAEVEPNQKERIILALKQSGNVVGYLGDGINEASALHAADVGISVASAVDVAKEAAQIVLLKQDLGVLVQGVREGRITFANILKYVFIASSANFGNMFSMAGVSLALTDVTLDLAGAGSCADRHQRRDLPIALPRSPQSPAPWHVPCCILPNPDSY